MKESIKKVLLCLIPIILGFAIGFFVNKYFTKPEIITIYDSSVEEAKIDSLNKIVQEKDKRILALKDSVVYIKTVVVKKEIEKIKSLPLSENVDLLKNNLVAYGEFTMPEDTIPTTIVTPQNDTLVVLSEGNVKDANEIAAKYVGELEVSDKLEKALAESMSVSTQKDSIILFKNTIIESQENIYTENLNRLENSLKKEKTKGTIVASILGTLAAVLAGIAIAK